MENSMQQLRQQCLSCENCPLAKTRHNVVFGVGVENAEVVFIGEGPAENEDLQGEPVWSARGGALLDKYLTAIDLSRDKNIYITNMVKCRPPQNRRPQAGGDRQLHRLPDKAAGVFKAEDRRLPRTHRRGRTD